MLKINNDVATVFYFKVELQVLTCNVIDTQPLQGMGLKTLFKLFQKRFLILINFSIVYTLTGKPNSLHDSADGEEDGRY